GNDVSGVSVTIALTSGTGSLSGTLTQVTGANGIASFNNLSINLAGAGKTLTGTSGALSTGESSAFNITVGTATALAFAQQPTDAVAGVAIAPAVPTRRSSDLGNDVSGVSVTIALTSGTGSLSGTLTQVTGANGIANFNNLSID